MLICGESDMRAQLTKALSAHATVEAVSSREDALNAVQEREHDAVFIDVDRSDESGFNTAARIRRATTRRLRLIAVSEFNRTSDLAASRAAGFDLRVTRPIKIEQVLAALRTIRS